MAIGCKGYILLCHISGSSVWVGGSINGRTWLWSNGQPLNFGWAKDEPNGANEDCVHVYSEKSYYLNDTPCGGMYPFICEIPGISLCLLISFILI